MLLLLLSDPIWGELTTYIRSTQGQFFKKTICQICNKKCKNYGELKAHMKTMLCKKSDAGVRHRDSEFFCPAPSCNFIGANLYHLTHHRLICKQLV